MPRIVVCPGSYDPPTYGHLDVITKAALLFDEVWAVVVHNPAKHTLFTVEERAALLRDALAAVPETAAVHVDVLSDGLLVDFCAKVGAVALAKGVRTNTDVGYEMPMAIVNRDLGGVETIFVLPAPQRTHVSSSLVRQVAALGGDVSSYVPENVVRALASVSTHSVTIDDVD